VVAVVAVQVMLRAVLVVLAVVEMESPITEIMQQQEQ
jgi:hypothetical protein